MPRVRPKRIYKVINICTRRTPEEQAKYMEEVMPIFVKLGLYKIVDENYKPKPIREIPIDEIGDEAGCEKDKAVFEGSPGVYGLGAGGRYSRLRRWRYGTYTV